MAQRGVFILGFQKCGTTFLHNLLSQSPYISTSSVKEPHFFSLKPYLVDQNISRYLHQYDSEIFLDSSVSYIHSESAMKLIRHYCPSAKAIILTRPRTERVISAFFHASDSDSREEYRPLSAVTSELCRMSNRGLTLKQSESLAIQAAASRNELSKSYFNFHKKSLGWDFDSDMQDPYWHFRYFSNSLYDTYINQAISTFGQENVLLLRLSELSTNPRPTINMILDWLQLPLFDLNLHVSKYHRRYFNNMISNRLPASLMNPMRKTYLPKLLASIPDLNLLNSCLSFSHRQKVVSVFKAFDL